MSRMTEKEAIAYIKAIKNGLHETGKDFPYRDEIIPVAKEALEMAIEALEQQDKVSDAIKEIRDLFKQPAAYVPNYEAYGLCLSIIFKHMEVEE